MAIQRLIGPDRSTGQRSGWPARMQVEDRDSTANATGVVTHIRYYSESGTGNVRFAIYNADLSTALTSDDSYTAIGGTGQNDYELGTPLSITSGTTYPLGGSSDTAGGLRETFNGVGPQRANVASWPEPFGGTESGWGMAIEGWGWVPPTVTDVNGGSDVTAGDTNVPVVGTNFMGSQGTGKIEICNNSDYDLATIKVEQTIESWSDTTAYITAVQGGLPTGSQTAYMFVTTDLGQRNATGFSFTFIGTGVSTNPCAVAATSPASEWTLSASQENESTVVFESPASEWLASAGQENQATAAFESPASDWLSSVEQQNPATVIGESPASEWTSPSVQENQATVAAESPASVWLILASDTPTNACTVVVDSPASEWLSTLVQENSAAVSGDSPASEWTVPATQENDATVSAESPASNWDANAEQENTATVSAESPASLWTILTESQEVNLCTVAINSPASEWLASLTQENSAAVIAESPASVWVIQIDGEDLSQIFFITLRDSGNNEIVLEDTSNEITIKAKS